MWWKIKIPYKRKIFIRLLQSNKILTKANLEKKDWNGNIQRHFCGSIESLKQLTTCSMSLRNMILDHWMRFCQNLMHQWYKFDHVIESAIS